MKEFSATTGHALSEDPTVKDSLTVDVDNQAMRILLLDHIEPSRTNPRQHFDPARLQELADSIAASGVHQPILVRPLPGDRVAETSHDPVRPTHEIVAGERRYRASRLAGKTTIPALIRALTDEQVLEIQIVENLQRDDLTELEEAEGYERLMQHSTLTAEAVGAKIGKSRSYVYARLKLLDLCTEARQALREGTIDASKALLLARIPDTALQLKALPALARKDYNGDPEMGYRRAASYIQREFMLRLDQAKFKIADATLVPAAGSCRDCPKRTGANPDLFADVASADVCTDPVCYHAKEDAHRTALLRVATERGQTIIEGKEARALMSSSYSGVEGYLRLDDTRDSPTSKTLRKLLGKDLPLPTVIMNPHKEGALIEVLPDQVVADLLKARGHADAAKAVEKDARADDIAQAAAEKQRLATKFENEWRRAAVEQTYASIKKSDAGGGTGIGVEVIRYLAQNMANRLNADRTRLMGQMLGLGKVAAGAGVRDHIKTARIPDHELLLAVMITDMEHRAWMPDGEQGGEALALVANNYGVDLEAIKAEIKARMRADVAEKRKAGKAKKAPRANDPAAPPAEGSGGGSLRKSAAPAAPARKSKTTPEEAMQGIAVAMQNMDAGPVAGDIDPLFESAVALIVREQKATVRLIKTELGIGTTKALELMSALEQAGKVSACDERGARKVLVAA